MKPKSLVVLLIVTAGVAGAAYYASSQRAPVVVDATGPLFEGLASKAGQIATINVVTKDGETVLQRRPDGAWAIQSKDGFPARLEAVANLVTDLNAAKIVETKTSEKSYYARLGVEDPETKDSTSTAVRLVTEKGDRLAGVVIGKAEALPGGPMAPPAVGNERRFVRRLGEDTTYLVEGSMRLERTAMDWSERTVLNLDSLRVRSATLTNPSGGTGEAGRAFTISRPEKAGALTLESIPAGQVLKDPASVDGVAGALSFVRVDDVKKFDPASTATGVVGEWRTFEGLVVKATQYDGGWFRFEARFEDATQGAEPQANQAAEISEDAKADVKGEPEKKNASEKRAEEVLAEAKKLNEAVAGWMFKLPTWKQELFTRKLSEMVKPADAPPPGVGGMLPLSPPPKVPPAEPVLVPSGGG